MRELWHRWKRGWRRLETSDPVALTKRRARQLVGTELRHFVQLRRPTIRRGDWRFTPDGLGPESVVVSAGVGEDLELEIFLVERFGARVHAFDPTPRALEWARAQRLPDRLEVHPLGLASYDGVAYFSPSDDPSNPCYTLLERPGTEDRGIAAQVRRISTLAETWGSRPIDLLKLDIEGAEYEVLDDLLDHGVEVRQILVEFHHRFPNVGPEPTRRSVERLERAGFRIVAISASGREYTFLQSGQSVGR